MDKPTENQIYTLVREYEAVIYDFQENMKRKGATTIYDILQEIIDVDLIEKLVRKAFKTKTAASKAIANCYSSRKQIAPAVREPLELFINDRGYHISLHIVHEEDRNAAEK